MSIEILERTGELLENTGVLECPTPVAASATAPPRAQNPANRQLPATPSRHAIATDFSWCENFRELVEQQSALETAQLASVSATAPELPDLGPGYEVLRKLGQGGMGAVYLGRQTETQHRVAIKVLAGDHGIDEAAEKRFQKEARLLAEVQHPNVANLLDVGVHQGTRFLVMELVEGTDLKGFLRQRGPLPERLALELISAIAEALAVAHARGIVHRDLKPANVLLTVPGNEAETTAATVVEAAAQGRIPQVKLTDFGLARHVDQAESLALTRTGAMLGTPYYIAPEQCSDQEAISPATDIYSLGATLFELLAGHPPFLADDPVKLITMHCFEHAPDLRKLNPEISDATAALVQRMLEKKSAARYADAAHLLEDLQRLVRGDAVAVELHPILPTTTGKIFEAQWTWEFPNRPEELWPWVSNTERVNAAVGLPSVEYTTRKDDRGLKHRFGTVRIGWAKLHWEEHPFEWIEGQRLGVLREFEGGPFHWFASIVELKAQPNGGTTLTHTVRIAPRGWIGQLLAHIEVNIKGRKPLDRVYRRIAEIVAGGGRASGTDDPFVPPQRVSATLQKKLEAARKRLAERQLDQSVLDRLMEFLAVSPAQELARIRPRPLARRLQLDPQAFTTVCLEASQAGLLELHWDILCPTCRAAAHVKDSLTEIDRHEHCEACDLDFDVDLSQSVELIFRVHPELRSADLRTYCIGGPEHAPHVVAQSRLAVGETVTLDLQLDPGTYILRGPQLPYALRFVVDPTVGIGRARVELEPGPQSPKPWHLSAGRQFIILENRYDFPLLIRLERAAPRSEAMTAADAQRLPVFRQLFPGEVVSREQLTNLSTNTLLGLRLTNLLDLYATLGDAQTCAHSRSVLSACRATLEAHGGKVLQEQDDGLLCSFAVAQTAALAAMEFLQQLTSQPSQNRAECRVVLYRGLTLSSSFSGRGDVFGRSVSYTKSLLDKPHAAPLYIAEELAADDEIQQFIQSLDPQLRALISFQSL